MLPPSVYAGSSLGTAVAVAGGHDQGGDLFPRRRSSYLTHSIVWFALLTGSLSLIPSQTAASFLGLRAQQAAEPRVIEITAKRFTFEPAIVEVTQGESVRLLVHSADGPHGFAIKALKIDKELERGAEPVKIDFTANEAGEFEILCSVQCGNGHSTMNGKLVVMAKRQEAP